MARINFDGTLIGPLFYDFAIFYGDRFSLLNSIAIVLITGEII